MAMPSTRIGVPLVGIVYLIGNRPSRVAISGMSQSVITPSCRPSFWYNRVGLSAYSFVLASSFLSHVQPAAVDPVAVTERARIAPKIARMLPDATGSRISTLPFHLGSSTSSQSFGAAESDTATLL